MITVSFLTKSIFGLNSGFFLQNHSFLKRHIFHYLPEPVNIVLHTNILNLCFPVLYDLLKKQLQISGH
jgi:hypothetical protein